MSTGHLPFARSHRRACRSATRAALAALVVAGVAPLPAQQIFENWVAGTPTSGPLAHVGMDAGSAAPIVVVGGSPNDTLGWNGSAFTSLGFTNSPGTGQAEAMSPFSGGMVYLDATGATAVLTGTAWSTATVLSPSPSARTFAAAATTLGPGGVAFVYGGFDSAANTLSDLWSFNGTAWSSLTSAPSARAGAALAHDGVGGLYVMGGVTSSTGTATNVVLRFSGGTWTTSSSAPFSRVFHAMVLDVARARLVVTGGIDASGNIATDAWAAPIDASGAIGSWSQISTGLPWSNVAGLTTATVDGVRQEVVALDIAGEVVNDQTASVIVVASSSTSACIVPNLQLVNSPIIQPRVGASNVTVGLGGLTGVAGAPMLLAGEFVTPAIGFASGTLISGSCMSFLSGSATTIGSTTTGAGGQYGIPLVIPPNPALVGSVLDLQAFGVSGSTFIASDLARMTIGR